MTPRHNFGRTNGGEKPLMRKFPSVFSLAFDSNALVWDYLDTNTNLLAWHPILRRLSFDWEMQDIVTLLGKLESVELKPDEDDKKHGQQHLKGSLACCLVYTSSIATMAAMACGKPFGMP